MSEEQPPPAASAEPDVEGWEIERKFLVPILPGQVTDTSSVSIRQGYLMIDAAGSSVRLRDKGGCFFQTIKQGTGLQRREVEVELTKDQFERLWPLTADRRLEKQRYAIPYEGHTIDLDVYAGTLSGLLTAEVEFESVEAANRFVPPAWFGREVTEDLRYTNQTLAVHGLPQDDAAA